MKIQALDESTPLIKQFQSQTGPITLVNVFDVPEDLYDEFLKIWREDAAYMKAGGVEVVRWPLSWSGAQATRNAPYDWGAMDQVVSVAARHGLRVLPFVYSTPSWLGKETRLPVDSGQARHA